MKAVEPALWLREHGEDTAAPQVRELVRELACNMRPRSLDEQAAEAHRGHKVKREILATPQDGPLAEAVEHVECECGAKAALCQGRFMYGEPSLAWWFSGAEAHKE